MDGPITGSKSRFLPRIQNDKLQLQLDAFKFHQETRPEMYITCNLQAYPVMDAVNPFHKACSFIDGSWKAADGDDWACYNCQGTKDYAPSFQSTLQQSGPPPAPRPGQNSSSPKHNKFQPRIQEGSGSYFSSLLTDSEPIPSWRNLILPQEEDEGIGSVGWELEKTVGPLAIFPKKSKMGFLAPPRVKEGVPLPSLSKDKKPMPHSSLWKNGVTAEMDQVGGVTPSPSWEPTVQPNITESEPESKKLEEEENEDHDGEEEDHDGEEEDHDGEEEDHDGEEEDHDGEEEDHDGEEEDHDGEEEGHGDEKRKGETKESDQGMWKTRLLPEEDFKEFFKTHASKNEEDSGLHTLGISRPEEEPADIYHPPKDS